jgi:hypothetical protein
MARHYAAASGFRERITAILEGMPDRDQKRFLNVLRQQLAASK